MQKHFLDDSLGFIIKSSRDFFNEDFLKDIVSSNLKLPGTVRLNYLPLVVNVSSTGAFLIRAGAIENDYKTLQLFYLKGKEFLDVHIRE